MLPLRSGIEIKKKMDSYVSYHRYCIRKHHQQQLYPDQGMWHVTHDVHDSLGLKIIRKKSPESLNCIRHE